MSYNLEFASNETHSMTHRKKETFLRPYTVNYVQPFSNP